jgi:hypothetical protein
VTRRKAALSVKLVATPEQRRRRAAATPWPFEAQWRGDHALRLSVNTACVAVRNCLPERLHAAGPACCALSVPEALPKREEVMIRSSFLKTLRLQAQGGRS